MADTPLKPASESKPHRLDYAPSLSIGQRLARRFPSAEQLVDFLKTLVWVAPLTLLIWVYAEREQSVVGPEISVSIDVDNSDPNRIVTLRGPADKNVIITLSGPRAKLDQIQPLLQPQRGGKAALVIPIDSQTNPGPRDLLTLPTLNDIKVFRDSGVTVKSAQPQKLFIDIDTFEERVADVKAPPEIANTLTDQSEFNPKKVTVRAPRSLMQTQPKVLVVYADLANRTDLAGAVGKQEPKNVPLYWPVRRENVTISPSTVSATLDIKPNNSKLIIPQIPISKESPPGFDNDFTVKYEPYIYGVEVTGPRDQIELMQKSEFKAKAVLEIASLDPDHDKHLLKFNFPPGVTLTPESAVKANWQYDKERR